MAEYIEREALLNHLKHRVAPMSDGEQLIKGVNLALEILEEAVEMLPAADVAPVVHGHWSKSLGDETLTENGFVHDKKYSCMNCWWGVCCATKLDFNYCPNCGAKMDEEVEDDV